MKKYTWDEIKNLVIVKQVISGIAVNDFGFNSICEELAYYQDEENRDVKEQLNYIFEQAIPDGLRDEYLVFLERV